MGSELGATTLQLGWNSDENLFFFQYSFTVFLYSSVNYLFTYENALKVSQKKTENNRKETVGIAE